MYAGLSELESVTVGPRATIASRGLCGSALRIEPESQHNLSTTFVAKGREEWHVTVDVRATIGQLSEGKLRY
jgi:hypothetical protein